MSEKVKDWKPAFEEMGTTLKTIFSEDVFASEGRVINEHWSPLSKAYAYQKLKRYPGKGLLEVSGAMRGSFVSMADANMLTIWNKAEYFKYHQSNAPRSRLPRRVMMKLDNPQKTIAVKIFQQYFREMTKG